MKRLLSVILCFVLLCSVISLVGCKNKNNENDKENTQIVTPITKDERHINPSEDLGEGNPDQQRIGE